MAGIRRSDNAFMATKSLLSSFRGAPTGPRKARPDDRLQRSIQYAAAFRFHHWRLGILDRPLSRAMTAESVAGSYSANTASRSRGAMRPSFCCERPALLNIRGRGECRVPVAPAASCALVLVERTRVTTSTPESPGIPARNGFNGLCRALPGDRALLPPSSADMFCLSPVGPT